MNLFSFLTSSDDLQMPQSWLSDTSLIRGYEEYTKSQLSQGCIVRLTVQDAASVKREEFWKRIEQKKKIKPFTRSDHGAVHSR